jgi:aspartate aminotransferase
MTGWSIGYLATTPELAKPMNVLRLTRPGKVNAPAQRAALAALTGPQDCVREMVAEYDLRRKSALKKLASVKGFTCGIPDSAFYFFGRFDADMTSAEMVDYLFSRKVAVRSGAESGACGEGWFRISYCGAHDDVEEGINRLAAGMNELS